MTLARALHTFNVGTQAIVLTLPDEYTGLESITGITKVSSSAPVTGAIELSEKEAIHQGYIAKLSVSTALAGDTSGKRKRKTLLITQPNLSNRGALVGKTIGSVVVKSASPKVFTKLR